MSQTAAEYLNSEVTRLVERGRGIAQKAADEGRTMTAKEVEEVEGLIKDSNGIKAKLQDMADNERLIEALKGADLSKPVEDATPAASVGEAFVRSENYKALMARGLTGNWATGPVAFGKKLTDLNSNSVESITGAGGTLPLQPQVLPILGPVEQKLYVADLFGAGVATQNTIVYLEETTTQPGALDDSYAPGNLPETAVTTSEGGNKPAAFIDFSKESVTIDKIAAFLPISDEMLEDEPQIASYINGRLPLFIRQAEESYLLAALLAVAHAADNSDVSGNNLFDSIAAGIMEVQVEGGLEPDAVVMNPVDFWKLAVTKNDTTGMYFSGGPYAGASRNPWGLTSVVTSAVAAGSPIVGAFREGATVWRKGGLSVEASNSHEDYFRRNLTAIRAEERLGLAVYRPGAFQVCTKV